MSNKEMLTVIGVEVLAISLWAGFVFGTHALFGWF